MNHHATDDELFVAALEQPAAERDAFLQHACGGDAAQRARVAGLLSAHAASDGFLEPEPEAQGLRSALPRPEARPGDQIDRYRLIERIGEGGHGEVHLAAQDEPIRRQVAIKIIKPGMDTREVIARFESERQALALMDHPDIARVLDAGTTAAQRPYFVMELVEGRPITAFCDEHRLPTPARLVLFRRVCLAIQHAHQKGIIHRDIKPSNILVALQDGVPAPKIIDFGIAKAVQGRLIDRTLFTASEQCMGTPTYMSPEQAGSTGQDVDTRTDIYSLGVLLYELLTGQPPFSRRDLAAAGLDEMRRLIRESDPQRPSARLRTLDPASLTATARVRSVEPPQLLHAVRGDLDWIVMRCLEKDRNRRYPTAHELAADLERHLRVEPVAARPPGGLYRMGKLVRRHKVAVGAVAGILVVVLAGSGAATWMFWRERAARERAVAAERAQAILRQAAEDAQRHAELEAAKRDQVASFLAEMLQGVGPGVALGRDTRLLKEILEKTAARVGRDFADQPEVEAELREVLGNVYRELAEYERAEEMLREARRLRERLHGPGHAALGSVLHALAALAADRADHARAEALFESAIAAFRASSTGDPPAVARSLVGLADVRSAASDAVGAAALLREALALQRAHLGEDHPDCVLTLSRLGALALAAGDHEAAEPQLAQVLALQRRHLGDSHPQVAQTLRALGLAQAGLGRLDEAAEALEAAVGMSRRLYGDSHPAVAESLDALALVRERLGEDDAVESLLREAALLWRASLGSNHPRVALTLNHLGQLAARHGRLAEAEAFLREAREIQESNLAPGHPERIATVDDLASVLLADDRPDEAAACARASLEMRRQSLGPTHPGVADGLRRMAVVLIRQGRRADAVAIAREAVELGRAWNSSRREMAASLGVLGHALASAGDAAGALACHREALELLREPPADRSELAGALLAVGAAVGSSEESDAARALLEEAIAIGRAGGRDARTALVGALTALGRNRIAAGEFGAAEPVVLEAVATARFLPADRGLLAPALEQRAALARRLGRAAEAEQFLREALQARRQTRRADGEGVFAMLVDLGALAAERGSWDEAAALLEEAAVGERALKRDSDSGLARVLAELAGVELARGRLDAAGNLAREALPLCQARFGPNHPMTVDAVRRLAEIQLAASDDWLGAAGLLERALACETDSSSPRPAVQAAIACQLGRCRLVSGDDAGAAVAFSQALQHLAASPGPLLPSALAGAGRAALALGETERAEVLLRDATAALERWGMGDASTAPDAACGLGSALAAQGRLVEARFELLRVFAADAVPPVGVYGRLGHAHALADLASVHLETGEFPQAEAAARAALALSRGERAPAMERQAFAALVCLGRAVARQGNTRQAERWLVEALALAGKDPVEGHRATVAVHGLMGKIRMRAGDVSGAESAWSAVMAAPGADTRACVLASVGLAAVAENRQHWPVAVEWLEAAAGALAVQSTPPEDLRRDVTRGHARLYHAWARVDRSKVRLAGEWTDRLLELSADLPSVGGGLSEGNVLSVPVDTLPAQVLNLPFPVAPVRATLKAVVWPNGPGSWRRNALWGQYVVALHNPGSVEVVVLSARLRDAADRQHEAGESPVELADRSRALRADARQLQGTDAPGFSRAPVNLTNSVGLAAVPPAFLVDQAYSLADQAEARRHFQRLRLPLPLVLAPGQTRFGCLYFPLALGPSELRLDYRRNHIDGGVALSLSLEPSDSS